eukprot:TRINITY_DN7394_c0_g1_i1.p2 TRINITY_DN7394_c0_g1~~TRINITY_DN7394_c0_g1_i1.p2  ORF type:complete len:173 (-),score=49.16 TRINITY_DN7394_c0_g1_i1:1365-1883(-)
MRKVKSKVLVLGNSAVGKSTLLQMYISGGQNYLKDYVMTQAADVQSKIITLEEAKKDVEMVFLDCSGQPHYKNIVGELMRDSNGLMFVYDVTNADSFASLQEWFDLARKANGGKKLPGVIVGTKIDLKPLRKVEPGEAAAWAKKFDFSYVEVSSAKMIDIEGPFRALAEKLV